MAGAFRAAAPRAFFKLGSFAMAKEFWNKCCQGSSDFIGTF